MYAAHADGCACDAPSPFDAANDWHDPTSKHFAAAIQQPCAWERLALRSLRVSICNDDFETKFSPGSGRDLIFGQLLHVRRQWGISSYGICIPTPKLGPAKTVHVACVWSVVYRFYVVQIWRMSLVIYLLEGKQGRKWREWLVKWNEIKNSRSSPY